MSEYTEMMMGLANPVFYFNEEKKRVYEEAIDKILGRELTTEEYGNAACAVRDTIEAAGINTLEGFVIEIERLRKKYYSPQTEGIFKIIEDNLSIYFFEIPAFSYIISYYYPDP